MQLIATAFPCEFHDAAELIRYGSRIKLHNTLGTGVPNDLQAHVFTRWLSDVLDLHLITAAVAQLDAVSDPVKRLDLGWA